jgi:hypothetical protein
MHCSWLMYNQVGHNWIMRNPSFNSFSPLLFFLLAASSSSISLLLPPHPLRHCCWCRCCLLDAIFFSSYSSTSATLHFMSSLFPLRGWDVASLCWCLYVKIASRLLASSIVWH